MSTDRRTTGGGTVAEDGIGSNATSQSLAVFHVDEIPRLGKLAAQVEDGPDKIQSILPGLLPSVAGVPRASETETVNAEIERRELPHHDSSMHFGELISAMKSHLEGETNEDFGRLVIGNEAGLQIGKDFWSSIFLKPFKMWLQHHPVQTMTVSSSSQITSHSMHSDFYFKNTYTGAFDQALDDLYPLPSQMLFIWRTYVENVDPFIKVIDVAALDEVCLASITFLGEEEALSCFDMSRTQLLARFRLGTEKTLASAGLLVTKEIETIQAFVIYLSILPHIGCQQLLSPFMGLLLRIATSVQLHRDAESFKTPALTPFQVEIRRRLWWQIIFIDSISRSGHGTGLAASDTMFDTKIPSRISASDQKSSSTASDTESKFLICILRCEIWTLCRFLNANQQKPLEQKLKAFNLTVSRLEGSYIAMLSSNNALESLVKTMTSLAFSKVEHTIYLQHFRNLKELLQMPSQEMVQHHLELSINILRDAHKLRTEPSWERWRWQLQGDFPWASMSAVFIQLCQSTWSATSERGWALTNQILKDAPDRVKKNASWDKLNQLITAAEVR
ncbi:hypothetical protein MKX08_005227, partial [Trichoderma sp. CBMAI-0020]